MTRRQASPSSRGTTGNARHRQPWPQEGAGVSTREFRPTFRPQAEQRPGLLSRQEGTQAGRGKERLSVPKALKKLSESSGTARRPQTTKIRQRRENHEEPRDSDGPPSVQVGSRRARWMQRRSPARPRGPAATSAPHPRVSAESGPGLRGLRLARPSAFSRPSGQRSFRRGKPRGPAKTRPDADSWGSGQRRSRGALKARMQGGAGSQEDQAGCQHEGGQGCH